MVDKFTYGGKKLTSFSIQLEMDNTYPTTMIYGETEVTETLPKDKKFSLLRVEMNSKKSYYTATFGQPVEDINNTLNQLSTWVGDVEKSTTSSTASSSAAASSSGSSSSTAGQASLTVADYLSVGSTTPIVMNGNGGTVEIPGTLDVHDSVTFDKDLTIFGTVSINDGDDALHTIIPCFRGQGNIISNGRLIFTQSDSVGYISTSETDYDSTTGYWTIHKSGYYDIILTTGVLASGTGNIGFYVNSDRIQGMDFNKYGTFFIAGIKLTEGTGIHFTISGISSDWDMGNTWVNIRYISG